MLMTNKLKNSNMHIEEMDKKYAESNNSLLKTIMQLKTLFSSISNSWFYAFIFIIVILFLLYKKIEISFYSSSYTASITFCSLLFLSTFFTTFLTVLFNV